MIKLVRLAIVAVMVTMASCTAMPPEAVQLSTSLGQMIGKSHVAHVNIVNKYFDTFTERIDKFALGDYKTAFINNAKKLAKQKDDNFVDFTPAQYDAIMTRIMTQRLEWLRSIDAERQRILREIDDYYALMDRVNKEVTNIVRSAAGVDSAKSQLIKDLTNQFGQRAKEIEDKLLGTNSMIETMLNDALKKVFGTQ